LKYQVGANDSDPGDILSYSVNDGPLGMSISSTGLITWVPIKGQIGEHMISVNISDGKDNIIVNFNVTVKKNPTTVTSSEIEQFIFIIIVAVIFAMGVIVVVYNLKMRTDGPSSERVKRARNRANDEKEQKGLKIENKRMRRKSGKIKGK
jgi:hypothetical protein